MSNKKYPGKNIELSAEEMKNKQIGYIRDNKHFLGVPLTDRNLKELIPCKETRELRIIQKEIKECKYNPENFSVICIGEAKLKFNPCYIYIIQDSTTTKACGVFVKNGNVVSIKLSGYNFTDPYDKKREWICINIKDALDKTGKIKKELFK